MAERNWDVTPELSRSVLEGSFPGDLGFEIVSISDEETVGRVVVDERHLHPGGYVHGGVWVAFGDTVAAWGTRRNLPADRNFTTAELGCNVFAAGQVGDELTARRAAPARRPPVAGLGGADLQGREARGVLHLHPDGAVNFARDLVDAAPARPPGDPRARPRRRAPGADLRGGRRTAPRGSPARSPRTASGAATSS